KCRGFHVVAALAIAGSLVPLVLSPARPLVPARWRLRMTAPMERLVPGIMARTKILYAVYAGRADPLHELCEPLPPDESVVGFMATADDSEISCWRPLGRRRVETVRLTDTAAALHARRVHWIAIRADAFWPDAAGRDGWLGPRGLAVVREVRLRSKARHAALEDWVLVHSVEATRAGD
ncbi:MAG TPA: hypothetical protein VG710_16480, partial [Opitutus sp.]|nr:hypothetical protein [Opitutus sp.]